MQSEEIFYYPLVVKFRIQFIEVDLFVFAGF